MKLLLDENLSDRIIFQIADLYPDSTHVKTLALIQSEDALIWEYAKANDFVIVSKDSDFHQRSLLYGHPPKFIYLRVGNCSTSKIVHVSVIALFSLENRLCCDRSINCFASHQVIE